MITFDPIEKVIQLDRQSVSSRELWTAYVDWSVMSDNLKYGVGLTQLGGLAPIALYVFLDLGWKIRPLEADGTTDISGILLSANDEELITPTLGDWNVLINLETPLQASVVEIGGGTGGGLTTEQDQMLREIASKVSILESILIFVRKYITNRTKINSSDKSLTLFDDDNTTPILTHDLKDRNGQPSIEEIHERIPK